MGWETRARGGRYYTHSRRVNGRVERRYFGCGELAHLIAMLDRDTRLALDALALQRRRDLDELRGELEALDAPVAGLTAEADALVHQALGAAGYHRHHRGEWRRRRAA